MSQEAASSPGTSQPRAEHGCISPTAATPTRLSPAGDYLMWAVAAHRDHFLVPDARLGELDPAGLHGIAANMIRSWHPDLRGLVGLADFGQTFLVRIRTSVLAPAWQPGRVTLLGDAIHAMSPARGSGANTALQDAGLLCQTLADAAPDGRALVAAIGRYETQMRQYGYAAVQASRQAEAAMGTRHSTLKSWLYRRLARDAGSS